ncbi:hypothetical protein WNY61_03435 [Sulfitobacter sp. AS92]|uniref:hypothetical protein n=1 Tax=Sulfitobacter sp. AS92 TaxID=3135783 RepID=UPI00317079FA
MLTKDETDLAHARGIVADCCQHSDAAVIAACATILILDRNGEDAHRVKELRETLDKSAA